MFFVTILIYGNQFQLCAWNIEFLLVGSFYKQHYQKGKKNNSFHKRVIIYIYRHQSFFANKLSTIFRENNSSLFFNELFVEIVIVVNKKKKKKTREN